MIGCAVHESGSGLTWPVRVPSNLSPHFIAATISALVSALWGVCPLVFSRHSKSIPGVFEKIYRVSFYPKMHYFEHSSRWSWCSVDSWNQKLVYVGLWRISTWEILWITPLAHLQVSALIWVIHAQKCKTWCYKRWGETLKENFVKKATKSPFH